MSAHTKVGGLPASLIDSREIYLFEVENADLNFPGKSQLNFYVLFLTIQQPSVDIKDFFSLIPKGFLKEYLQDEKVH